jgi:hypothetical protein
MAGKPEVTLTFAGDHSDLTRSFDKVGSGADKMGRDVSSSFDRVGESADTLDTRAMGFRDTMTGVEDTGRGLSEVMKGNVFDGVLLLGMGFGDLASGVANFGTQFARQAASFVTNTARMTASHVAGAATTVAGWVTMGIQSTIAGAKMAAAWLIGLGPVGLVIAGIAAVVAILVALGVDFEDVKNAIGAGWEFIRAAAAGAFEWVKTNWPLVLAIITGPIGLAVLAVTRHWGTIKSGFTAVKNWIRDRVSDVVGIFRGLPGRLAGAASGLWGFITSGFKSAINTVIGWWNGLRIPGFEFHQSLPGPLPDINFSWRGVNLPNIPTLHSGGMFHAPPGRREGLAMLLDGERVTRPGAGGGLTVNVYVAGSIRSDRDLVRVIRDEFGRGGLGGFR